MVLLYMVLHGSHQYTPDASIYTSTMDPSWAMESPMEMDDEKWVPPWIGNHHIVVECVIECVLIYCLILLMFWHQPPQSTL